MDPGILADSLVKITKNMQIPSYECFNNNHLKDALFKLKDELTSEILSLHLHDFKSRSTGNKVWSNLLE
jgi:hypothetical protein